MAQLMELGGSLDAKYWVQKSDPLLLMRAVPFSIGELKILDTYISRINAMDESKDTVMFTKDEYETLMGVSSIDYRTLKKYTEGMLGKVVTLEMPDKQYTQFVLFDEADYRKDDFGRTIIALKCTRKAKELFFCIGKYHYFMYALENVIKLSRKSSYLLYLYIQYNRFRGEWEIDVNKLRDEVLDCKGNESYQAFKVFKRDVLEVAAKEVNAKTDCKFTYDTVKLGRKVVKIKFTYLSKNKEDEQLPLIFEPQQDLQTAPEVDSIDEMDEDEKMFQKYGSENLAFLAGACDFEFTKEEMRVIYNTILEIKGSCPDNEKYDYLKHKYDILKDAATKSTIRYRFNYFLTIIKNTSGEYRS